MRRLVLTLVAVSLCFVGSIAYSAPFAAHLGSSWGSFAAGQSVDLQFTLSEQATTVTLEVIGPLPATTVQRTFDLGCLGRGDHSVAWNGKNDSAVDVPIGDYKFKVAAESDGYGGSWKNITPIGAYTGWTTGTTELEIADHANAGRGIGFNGTNLIISGTTPIQLSVVNGSGEFQNTLGLTVVDTYDADDDGNYAETWSLNASLGPYDIATATDNKVYVGAYRGASFPISRIESDAAAANPVAVCFQNASCRAIDAANGGANTIIYQVAGSVSGSPGNAIRVFDSDDGTTFSLLETTAAMPDSHMVIGRDGNTGGNGDVLWVSSNTGYVERWVRSGGSWAKDNGFSGPENVCGGDYVQINGMDVIVVILNSNNDIVFADGNTGNEIARWSPPGSRASYGGNGDLTVKSSGTRSGAVYFTLPDYNIFGKLLYTDLGSLQYYTAGMGCIEDQSSPYFGYLFVSSSYPASSSNVGATADEQGLYILKCDGTFYGGDAASAYAAADNNPSANWDPTDNWSPYRTKAGVDDNLIYVGDWGTYQTTDDVMQYYGVGTGNTASQLLLANSGDHGRIYSTLTTGTQTQTILIGLDRDSQYGIDMYYWEVGSTVYNYTGTRKLLIDGPNVGSLSDIYSMKDFAVDSDYNVYLANARASDLQSKLLSYNPTTNAFNWYKTGATLSSDSGGAFFGGNYCYSIDYSDDKDWVGLLEYSTNPDVVVYSKAGTFQSTFSLGTGMTASYFRIICFAPDGNMWVADNISEHTWQWAPPGASTYTTTFWDKIVFGIPSEVGDWMLY